MIKFESIASSSKGNFYILADGDTGERLFIEAGIPYKEVKKAAGYRFNNVVGALITHEHTDHSRSAVNLIKDGVPVYTSAGTADAAQIKNTRKIEAGVQIKIGGFDVLPFNTFHDSAEPLGFLIRSPSGGKILFATDTYNIPVRARCEILAVEANYDKALMGDDMALRVRQRIAHTHMEIHQLCAWLRGCDLSICREIHLLHLSAASSDEEKFARMVRECVPGTVAVHICDAG